MYKAKLYIAVIACIVTYSSCDNSQPEKKLNAPDEPLTKKTETITYDHAPQNKAELVEAIKAEIKRRGNNANLNNIDTSAIIDMKSLFSSYPGSYNLQDFAGDISRWDVSKVTDMSSMFFYATSFNGDISGWNVSKVADMSSMFFGATSFDQDISGWNVSKVADMSSMFSEATSFDQDISQWDVSNVTDMIRMFYGARSFIHTLEQWKEHVAPVSVLKDAMFWGSGVKTLPSWCKQEDRCDKEFI